MLCIASSADHPKGWLDASLALVQSQAASPLSALWSQPRQSARFRVAGLGTRSILQLHAPPWAASNDPQQGAPGEDLGSTSRIARITLPAGTARSTVARKCRNSWCRWRAGCDARLRPLKPVEAGAPRAPDLVEHQNGRRSHVWHSRLYR